MSEKDGNMTAQDVREKRQHARYDCSMMVQIMLGDEVVPATVTNLSQGGAFIEFSGDELLQLGEELVLRIKLPKVSETAEIPFVVRWSTHAGAGVQFTEIGPLHVWGLNNLVSTLQKSTK